MPGRDGTGPFGTYKDCKATDGEYQSFQGRKPRGRGGRGRGFMNRFHMTGKPGWKRWDTEEDRDLEALKTQINELTEMKKDLENRLKNLENKD